ncbi:MAG: hypothetical protein ACYDD4_10955 [Acidimicrobiales bacterium]
MGAADPQWAAVSHFPRIERGAALVVVGLPFAIWLVRIAAWHTPIFLSGDVGVIDLDVRSAMHFGQLLGPYDRFGWHHPGPLYFYALAFPSWLFGAGARAELIGVALVNGGCAVAAVTVVLRRCGPWAALWAVGVVDLLAWQMAAPFLGQPLPPVAGTWNPFVVTMPLLLCLVLCAAAVESGAVAGLAALVVGSFCVQTDLSTTPIVAAGVAVGVAGRVAMRVGARRGTSPARDREPWRWRLSAVLGVALVAVWIAPLVQQLTVSPGNLTLIVRFFAAHHHTQTLGAGLWTVLAVDASLVQGMAQAMGYPLGAPHAGAEIFLAAVLALSVLTLVAGVWRRAWFGVAAGAIGLLGFAVMTLAVTRIVGGLWGYLVIWSVAVAAVALVGIGSVLPWKVVTLRVACVALASVAGIACCVRMAEMSPGAVSDPDLAAAWHDLAPHLGRDGGPVDVVPASTDLLGTGTFIGVVVQLAEHGDHPVVPPPWANVFGSGSVSYGRRARLRLTLYPPSPAIERMAGYIGHTADADLVLTR